MSECSPYVRYWLTLWRASGGGLNAGRRKELRMNASVSGEEVAATVRTLKFSCGVVRSTQYGKRIFFLGQGALIRTSYHLPLCMHRSNRKPC